MNTKKHSIYLGKIFNKKFLIKISSVIIVFAVFALFFNTASPKSFFGTREAKAWNAYLDSPSTNTATSGTSSNQTGDNPYKKECEEFDNNPFDPPFLSLMKPEEKEEDISRMLIFFNNYVNPAKKSGDIEYEEKVWSTPDHLKALTPRQTKFLDSLEKFGKIKQYKENIVYKHSNTGHLMQSVYESGRLSFCLNNFRVENYSILFLRFNLYNMMIKAKPLLGGLPVGYSPDAGEEVDTSKLLDQTMSALEGEYNAKDKIEKNRTYNSSKNTSKGCGFMYISVPEPVYDVCQDPTILKRVGFITFDELVSKFKDFAKNKADQSLGINATGEVLFVGVELNDGRIVGEIGDMKLMGGCWDDSIVGKLKGEFGSQIKRVINMHTHNNPGVGQVGGWVDLNGNSVLGPGSVFSIGDLFTEVLLYNRYGVVDNYVVTYTGDVIKYSTSPSSTLFKVISKLQKNEALTPSESSVYEQLKQTEFVYTKYYYCSSEAKIIDGVTYLISDYVVTKINTAIKDYMSLGVKVILNGTIPVIK